MLFYFRGPTDLADDVFFPQRGQIERHHGIASFDCSRMGDHAQLTLFVQGRNEADRSLLTFIFPQT